MLPMSKRDSRRDVLSTSVQDPIQMLPMSKRDSRRDVLSTYV